MQKLRAAQVTDAASEAKANVRCLATLETSLAPMAGGAPKAALAALPALVAALHAMHTVSRYWESCLAMHDSFTGAFPWAYSLQCVAEHQFVCSFTCVLCVFMWFDVFYVMVSLQSRQGLERHTAPEQPCV